MYKKFPFARKSVAEVKKDIDLMPRVYGTAAKTAFLGDSNSLLLKAADLVEILEYLYRVFPRLERVTSYARAKTIIKKSPAELRAIRKAGLTRLHIGLESGSDQVLTMIRQGATAAEMVRAGLLAKEAGFECSFYVLLGIGGLELTQEHRRGTIEVLNQVDPHFIRVRTLTPIPKTPIAEWIAAGKFTPVSPLVSVEEELDIVKGLRVTSRFLNDHVSNIVPLDGQLPADQAEMVAALEAAVAYCRENEVAYTDYRHL
jgi:radical SAM superfamily enzyme YgiQ (UPF0313 family)